MDNKEVFKTKSGYVSDFVYYDKQGKVSGFTFRDNILETEVDITEMNDIFKLADQLVLCGMQMMKERSK